MFTRSRSAVAVAVLSLTACGGAGGTGAATPRVGPAIGDVAPIVTGTSLQGNHISVPAWRGSVAVVLFWASWCEPCKAEQPAVNALTREPSARAVHFLGISVDAEPAAARGYLQKYAVPYDSLIDDTSTQTLALAFEIRGPPQTFVIDAAGRIAAHIVGPFSTDQLRADITAAEAR